MSSAFNDACIIDRRWHTVLRIYVASQSIQHLRLLQVITSSLYAVSLAKLLKLDTLPPLFLL